MRGYTGVDLTVYGARRPLHSGHYGNWAPNPSLQLARLLASMKDADGRVLIEGFYDSVEPLGGKERAALEALPAVEAGLKADLALAASEGQASLAERLLVPSFNLRGLDGGAVGERARNVIPTEATASLDLRLVRGNDPEAMLDLVEAHLRRQGYHVISEEPDPATRGAHPKLVRMVRRVGYPAARTPLDRPEVAPVIAAARRVAGKELILMPSLGGSLPLYLFTRPPEEGGLGRPVVIVPLANHDNNQHGPDENLRLGNLWYGVELMAALLTASVP